MDQVTDITKKIGLALWAATVWAWARTWATIRWTSRMMLAVGRATGRAALGTVTKLARICLWIVFWPLGLWRSIRHGRKKDNAKLLAEVKRLRDAA